jgi:hypothetical protein
MTMKEAHPIQYNTIVQMLGGRAPTLIGLRRGKSSDSWACAMPSGRNSSDEVFCLAHHIRAAAALLDTA